MLGLPGAFRRPSAAQDEARRSPRAPRGRSLLILELRLSHRLPPEPYALAHPAPLAFPPEAASPSPRIHLPGELGSAFGPSSWGLTDATPPSPTRPRPLFKASTLTYTCVCRFPTPGVPQVKLESAPQTLDPGRAGEGGGHSGSVVAGRVGNSCEPVWGDEAVSARGGQDVKVLRRGLSRVRSRAHCGPSQQHAALQLRPSRGLLVREWRAARVCGGRGEARSSSCPHLALGSTGVSPLL